MNEREDSPGVGGTVTTGHAEVDAAMASIADLGDADLATHAATFERVHEVLRTALTATPVDGDRGQVPAIPES